MRIAVTGHRPNKLGGEYNGVGIYSNAIRRVMQEVIDLHKPTQLISGMALGVDQLWAEAAILNNIPFIAAIPCTNQDLMWPPVSRVRYNKILSNPLCSVHYVSMKPYTKECMQARNIWMVDNSDTLLAIWDGSAGGTKNCHDYAVNHRKGSYVTRVMSPKLILENYNKSQLI